MNPFGSNGIPMGCLFLLLTACGSAERGATPPVDANRAPQDAIERPGLPLPKGFDIRVAGTVDRGQIGLDIEVDIPEGSYVISALSERDYLGKFQILWADSLITQTTDLVEEPSSMPGWEPWDEVYTPMLFHPTTIRQLWDIPSSIDTAQGEIFFVLEPQCVPYAVDFKVVMATGVVTNGLVNPQYPD